MVAAGRQAVRQMSSFDPAIQTGTVVRYCGSKSAKWNDTSIITQLNAGKEVWKRMQVSGMVKWPQPEELHLAATLKDLNNSPEGHYRLC